ncbi:MAG: type II toxin-antitoxin system VapC family toxin [Vitreimonas sp.]
MRLLLDSQALLWVLFDKTRLSAGASVALGDAANVVTVSTISPYELEVKKTAGRLNYPDVHSWESVVAAAGFQLLPFSASHGVTAARLPRIHRDPWDRLLIGQAMIEALTLVTSDRRIPKYGVPTLW